MDRSSAAAPANDPLRAIHIGFSRRRAFTHRQGLPAVLRRYRIIDGGRPISIFVS